MPLDGAGDGVGDGADDGAGDGAGDGADDGAVNLQRHVESLCRNRHNFIICGGAFTEL